MSELPGVVITGGSGRMGQMLIKEVQSSDQAKLVGVVERPGHDWSGRDLGEVMGGAANGVTVTDDAVAAIARAEIVIDFTAPEATLSHAGLAAQARAVHVIGTTGFTDAQLAQLEPAARHATIVRAGNMSLGVNLLVQLTKQVAAALDADFDIEVVEAHHRHKVDAPSGTALALGEAAAAGRNVNLDSASVRVRDGHTGPRQRGTIGFATLRGGDVTGEHSVIFAGTGERVEITHKASSRQVFAEGAVRAARWTFGKPPGLYGMRDVLEI